MLKIGFFVGENLFRKAIVGNVQPNEIPAFGGGATEGWFGELINYQYAGPNAGAGQCPFRNEDEKKNPAVLHLTAVSKLPISHLHSTILQKNTKF